MRNEEFSKTAHYSIDIGRPVRMNDGTAFAVGIRQSGSFQRRR
jgi:hypothetical protein